MQICSFMNEKVGVQPAVYLSCHSIQTTGSVKQKIDSHLCSGSRFISEEWLLNLLEKAAKKAVKVNSCEQAGDWNFFL